MHVGTSCVPAVCVVREFVQTAYSAGGLDENLRVRALKWDIHLHSTSERMLHAFEGRGCRLLCWMHGSMLCKGRLCGATAVRVLLELKVPGELQGTEKYAHHCNFWIGMYCSLSLTCNIRQQTYFNWCAGCMWGHLVCRQFVSCVNSYRQLAVISEFGFIARFRLLHGIMLAFVLLDWCAGWVPLAMHATNKDCSSKECNKTLK
jgi:hypothetical protein